MAAIDKIYVNSWEQYLQFKEWCEKQPPFKDKYGVPCRLIDYVYKYSEPFDNTRAIFMGPYYLDAYLIRNCPFDFIQEELMLNYGYWSQKRIREYYENVKNDADDTYWAKLEDFVFNEDGTITLKGLEKSDYELIKEGSLYATPFTSNIYEIGKHFKCIRHPHIKYNTPFNQRNWMIMVDFPKEFGFAWYHSKHNSWDFWDEFVIDDWSSSTAYAHTIKAIKRLIRKWKLPIGSKIEAIGRYIDETYEFIVTK